MFLDNDLRDKSDSSIEKAIKYILSRFIEWASLDGPWGSVYKGYYAPHIQVFSRLITSQIVYNGTWQYLTQLRKCIDEYATHLSLMMSFIEPVPPKLAMTNRAHGEELLKKLNGVIRGARVVVDCTADSLKEINKALDIDKPRNVLQFVLGNRAVHTQRNSVCDSVKGLIEKIELVQEYKNKWAILLMLPTTDFEMKLRIQEQCQSTLF